MRSTSLLPLVLLVACNSSGITSEQKVKLVESYQETAQQYYTMGDLDRANAQCLKGLALEPGNERLKLIQAWTLQRRGFKDDIAQAESLFRGLQKGGDFRAVLGLAEALERKGLLFSESASNLKSGKRVTEAADPAARVSDLETQAEKAWNESLIQYEKALQIQKEDADCFSGLARVEALRGNVEKAFGWAQKLCDVTHRNREFWSARLTRADMTTSDESRLQDTVRMLTRTETTAHVTASTFALQLNRPADALVHLDTAAELDPSRAECFSLRAQVNHDLGRHADAIRDVERFIALSDKDPNHPDIERAFRLRKQCQDALGGAR